MGAAARRDKPPVANFAVSTVETITARGDNGRMEDLERMAIFAAVVEARGFSEAARRLGLSKSFVSKQVTRLEKNVGARLLHRTTRSMSLTEAGAVFYEHCARIVEEQAQAREAVGRFHAGPRGTLRIATSVAFGTLHIAPALPDFLARHPDRHRANMVELLEWCRQGRIVPHIHGVFTLAETADALRLIEGRKVTGKVIVNPQL